MWRQQNFLTLPNFALLVSVWKELEKCPSAHRPSSFQLRSKVLFWCAWCPQHIPPYSLSFLLLSSPVLQNTLHSSARAKYPLLFPSPWGNSSLAALNSHRGPSLPDRAAASGLLLPFWSRCALLTDLCCLAKVLGTRTRPLCFVQSVSVLCLNVLTFKRQL